MKREDLEKALGGMEDSFIESANQRRSNKERPVFWPVAAAAAVLLLSVVGISMYGRGVANKNKEEVGGADLITSAAETTASELVSTDGEEKSEAVIFEGPAFLRMPITEGNFAWNMTRKEVLEELMRLAGIEDSVKAEEFESEDEYCQRMKRLLEEAGALHANANEEYLSSPDDAKLAYTRPLKCSLGVSYDTVFFFSDYSFMDRGLPPNAPKGLQLTSIHIILTENEKTGAQLVDELSEFYGESDPITEINSPLPDITNYDFHSTVYEPKPQFELVKYENWKVGNLPEERKKIYYELYELNRERVMRQLLEDRGLSQEQAQIQADIAANETLNDETLMLNISLFGPNLDEPNVVAVRYELDYFYTLANCIEESRNTSDEGDIEDPTARAFRMPITAGNFSWNMTRKEVLEEMVRLVGIENSVKAEAFESEEEYCLEMERRLFHGGALYVWREDFIGVSSVLEFVYPLETEFGISNYTRFDFRDYEQMTTDEYTNKPMSQFPLQFIKFYFSESPQTGDQWVDDLTEYYNESNPEIEIISMSDWMTDPEAAEYDEYSFKVYNTKLGFENWKISSLSEEKQALYRKVKNAFHLNRLEDDQILEIMISSESLNSAVPVQISFNFDPSFMLMNAIENGNEEELKEAKALWEEMNNLSQDTTN